VTTAICVDTETTGTSVDAELLEVAYTELSWSESGYVVQATPVVERFYPSVPIEAGALAAHHILREDLEGCPPSSSWVPPVVDYIVGHNVDFDAIQAKFPATVRRICTLALARYVLPNAGSHKLGALLYHYYPGKEAQALAKQAHSAAADIAMCVHVLNSMIPELGLRERAFAELWQASEIARVPKVMAFGKYKGSPVEKVPRDYQQWYARQEDPDPYLLRAWGMK